MTWSGLDAEERFARLEGIGWRQFERFQCRGVAAGTLAHDLPARARVVFLPDRPLFEFADDVDEGSPERAFVFEARDELGDVCDLIAWAPAVDRIAAWYGRASILGLDSLYAFRLANDGALLIHETPLDWLVSNREGVVIVNPESAVPALWDVRFLCAPNEKYGRYLRKLLASRQPRIVVSKDATEAEGARATDPTSRTVEAPA